METETNTAASSTLGQCQAPGRASVSCGGGSMSLAGAVPRELIPATCPVMSSCMSAGDAKSGTCSSLLGSLVMNCSSAASMGATVSGTSFVLCACSHAASANKGVRLSGPAKRHLARVE
eukprot:719866-Amphidinium_carterae.4